MPDCSIPLPSLVTAALSTATLGAVLHFGPTRLPLLTPCKGSLTNGTDPGGQISFFLSRQVDKQLLAMVRSTTSLNCIPVQATATRQTHFQSPSLVNFSKPALTIATRCSGLLYAPVCIGNTSAATTSASVFAVCKKLRLA